MKVEKSQAINPPSAITDRINEPVQSPMRLRPLPLVSDSDAIAVLLALAFLTGGFFAAMPFVPRGVLVAVASAVTFVSVTEFVTVATMLVSVAAFVATAAFVSMVAGS